MADTQQAPAIDATRADQVADYIADKLENEEKELDTSKEGDENPDAETEAQNEGEAEENEQESDADPEEQEEKKEPTHKVKIDGAETEVPLSELLKGYTRQADYTRKTTEVAEQRKALEQERAQAVQVMNQVQSLLVASDPLLMNEHKIDWMTLARQDPGKYSVLKEQLNQSKAKIANLVGMQQQYSDQMARQAFQSGIDNLLKAMPELEDEVKYKEFQDSVYNHAKDYGITENELERIADHRFFLLMRDAMKAKKLEESMKSAQNKKIQAQPGKVQKPGTGQTQSQEKRRNINQLKQRANNGDRRAFEALLEME